LIRLDLPELRDRRSRGAARPVTATTVPGTMREIHGRKAGSIMSSAFQLGGHDFTALNGGVKRLDFGYSMAGAASASVTGRQQARDLVFEKGSDRTSMGRRLPEDPQMKGEIRETPPAWTPRIALFLTLDGAKISLPKEHADLLVKLLAAASHPQEEGLAFVIRLELRQRVCEVKLVLDAVRREPCRGS
jgi:hypothetical protein